MQYPKGAKIAEGKTKIIWEMRDSLYQVVVENKDAITAHDDPRFTRKFGSKARCSTATTCRCFELLKKAGIPVAYDQQLSETEFLAPKVEMIPLEVVARRYFVGSFLKRNPQFAGYDPPYRAHQLYTEFFLKTTKGKLIGKDGKTLVEGLDPEKGEEDPLIINPHEKAWMLFHSKKPKWESEADLKRRVNRDGVVDIRVVTQEMDSILRQVFLVLEGAWNVFGYRLIDLKIEFGMTADNKLVVADVIDNDSWRLRTAEWRELSKQVFRDGGESALAEVEENYGIVAGLAEQFYVPKQAIVFWTGSDKDNVPKWPYVSTDVSRETIVCSGHKKPVSANLQLESILAKYPQGGVIIAKVGMSNGLGPMLAARTSWPVISVVADAKSFSEDVWSSLRCPSSVPMATVLSEANAMALAANILAQKNPLLYMLRQMEIEALDINVAPVF